MVAFAVTLSLLWSSPPPPVVEGVSQITDDGNPKSITGLVSDGSRVYFNEIRDGTQVLAEVATTGGESGLITPKHSGFRTGGDSIGSVATPGYFVRFVGSTASSWRAAPIACPLGDESSRRSAGGR